MPSKTIVLTIPDQVKRLNPMALEELKDLDAKGFQLTLDDVVWIDTLCRKIGQPVGGGVLPTGIPCTVGNVTLWPFTIQGQEWYYEALNAIPRGTIDLYILAYALALGRTEGAFDTIRTAATIETRLREWKRGLTCTDEELAQAVLKVAPVDDGDTPDTAAEEMLDEIPPPEYAEMVANLVALTGIEPEVWCRKVSVTYLLQQMAVIAAVKQAESGSKQLSQTEVQAYKNLGVAIKTIRERGKLHG